MQKMLSNRIAAIARSALSRPSMIAGGAPTPLSSTFTFRSFVCATAAVFEKHTMKVPTMGDSITEGTIVEWTVQVGQAVKEDDVVALIETDKVTVDIKATMSGVVTQQFGAVDETVEVGADLCEIDTEAVATVDAAVDPSSEAAPATDAPPAAAPAAAPTPAAINSQSSTTKTQAARNPSIKFLGKDGWARVLSGGGSNVVQHIPANYGRLSFSEEEMEALIMGGANIAPEVKD